MPCPLGGVHRNRSSGVTTSRREHFETHGWLRIQGAFTREQASAMCEVIWQALRERGVDRDDPSTWTEERPAHLQRLKSHPVFSAVGSDRTIAAINEALEGQPWVQPKSWGSLFPLFPAAREWNVPSDGWHIDWIYSGRLSPPCGVKVHSMLNDIGPRCGGMNIISGSHRLLHSWFSQYPAPPGARTAQLRRSVHRHPYLRDLCTQGDPEARIARFHENVEIIDGIPLQVIENTASAGDVILMHSLLLHAMPSAHTGMQPRFLLNQEVHV